MFTKTCPKCGSLQKYKTLITFCNAEKNNAICRSCSQKIANKLRPQNQKGFKNINAVGDKNHMHGRSIYDIWAKKFDSETVAELKKQHAEKSTLLGPACGMYGKTLKQVWTQKYGEEVAQRKHAEWKTKLGRLGPLNPQYGKPAPAGSGRGIKGWLHGLFFRSLLEMQYIYYRIKNGDRITSAELGQYKVSYIDNKGRQKTYHPDFLINNTIIVEVKPSSLVSNNKEKLQAARYVYGDKFLVETEKSFPFCIDEEVYQILTAQGHLIIYEKDRSRVMINLKTYKRIL